MKAYHNSRVIAYRSPYGAITPGTAVKLSLDVWDAPGATATLRTWVDGVGEELYPMEAVEAADADGEGTCGNGALEGKGSASACDGDPLPTRFAVTLSPKQPGIIWYQFIIGFPDGSSKRYGAQDGRTGGEGRLLDWEPPSFQLTVYSKKATTPAGKANADMKAMSFEQLAESLDGSKKTQLVNEAFARTLTAFVRGEASAKKFAELLESQRENYPAAVLDRALFPLGAPDAESLLALMGGNGGASAEDAAQMNDTQRGLGKGRIWCASLIQALLHGTPAVYADTSKGTGASSAEGNKATAVESGTVEGGNGDAFDAIAVADPLDGASYPWAEEDPDCLAIAQNVADLRRVFPFEENTLATCFSAGNDVFGIWRSLDDGGAVCVLVNGSLLAAHDVYVPMAGDSVSEVISGYGVGIVDAAQTNGSECIAPAWECAPRGKARLACMHLYQLGSAILYFHGEQRLDKPAEPGLGVLAHITSIPNGATDKNGKTEKAGKSDKSNKRDHAQFGTLGAPARAFVDWLAEGGARYWQVLPVNPTDGFGSPYAGISAFAGNTRLLEDSLTPDAIEALAANHAHEYRAFCEREHDWLEPYAFFMAIRAKLGTQDVWQDWPKKYRHFDPAAFGKDQELASAAERVRQAQFAFELQWSELKSYANERGVQIVGDMPIYVSPDSADVWANPDIFQLDRTGEPAVVAGCPPDRFAADGQVWGNPVYDWDALKADGYHWWMRRLERAFDLYDIVRLDHFIGFARYFSIPAGEKGTAGTYHPGPGLEFFRMAHEKFGPLPIIAEDLGMITPAVRSLVALCGFPGMDIVQFVDGDNPLGGYTPRPEKIAYTGTHDNQTLAGYAMERYPDLESDEVVEALMDAVAACSASICVFPLQDILGLDDEARMNTPGVPEGNWMWQANADDVAQALDALQKLVALRL